MKKISSLVVLVFLFVTMFSTFGSTQIALANASPVIATDTTVVCNGAPAGMRTKIQDTNDGFITVTLILKGTMNINSFSWALKYDSTKVVPVTFSGKADAPNSILDSETLVSPYFSVTDLPKISGWPMSSYIIENSSGVLSGNFILIGYAKSGGSTLALGNGTESNLLKMYFRKKATIDTNTFSYFYSTAGLTIVSKLIYSTTNILTDGTNSTDVHVRPDLFTFESVNVFTPGPTPTPTLLPSNTPVATATPVRTATPMPTATPVRTATPMPTATPVATATPVITATPLVTATPTIAPTPPAAPTITSITNAMKSISGKAANSGLVTVKIGTKTYTKTVVGGAWKISLPSVLAAGTKVTATVKLNGLTSTIKMIYVIPATPLVKHIEPNSTTVKGTATKGSVVYAKVGSKAYMAKASTKTGAYTIKTPKIKKGTSVSVRCKAGGQYSASKVVKAI